MRIISIVGLVVLGLAVTDASLPINNPNFNDPFGSAATVAMLDINVFTFCPDHIRITVTHNGNGDAGSPQFALGDWTTTSFVGDPNKCAAMPASPWCGADISYTRTGNVAVLTFTHILDINPAVDNQGNPMGPGWWNFYVAVPVSNFVVGGPTPLLIVEAGEPSPYISTRDKGDFEAFLDGIEVCRGPSVTQDPIFTGFQGQVYQFHGLPDEHFNLVSSPDVQVNSHFVYLSSGKCDYNDTACWTHPGTYVDVLGFTIGGTRLKVQAGSHDAGMRVWIQDVEIPPQQQRIILSINNSSIDTATIIYNSKAQLQVLTPLLNFQLENSDQFLNLNAALNDMNLLRTGSHRHEITDHNVCKTQTTHDHQLVESMVAKKYHAQNVLHGLVGQTWRNVKVCGRDWMGQVEDYLVADGLFGTSYNYNYFSKQN